MNNPLFQHPLKPFLYLNEEILGGTPINCPFCNQLSKDLIQHEDYVDIPMIWCDYCGARALLDPIGFEIATSQKKLTQVFCLFITRASDHIMYQYCSETNLTQEQIKLLQDNNYDKEILKKLKVKEIERDEDNVDMSNILNISIPIESYNLHNPKLISKVKFDDAHDGVFITLEYIDQKNKVLKFARFWGD